MSFSERNVAPRDPAGPDIPFGVRKSLLDWFDQRGITRTFIWETFVQRATYGTWEEIEDDIRARFGGAEADEFASGMAVHEANKRYQMVVRRGVNADAEPALHLLPPALFLDALEIAVRPGERQTPPSFEGITEINRVFSRRGVSYKFDFNGRAEWYGDAGAHDVVLKPALDALADPRLAGCRSEFQAAREHLRKGTNKDAEDAIEESGKAVESAMKVLLNAHGVAQTGKETARPLFDLLTTNGIVEAEADNGVLTAMRIRNQWGGHGAGAAPRVPPGDLAELAVRGVASAIVYLAGRLP